MPWVFAFSGGLVIYTMLITTYWGVKRMAEFKTLIKGLGPIILDPYGGSGELVRAALKIGKRVIYNDLNPIATLIARFNTVITNDDKIDVAKCLDIIKPITQVADKLYTLNCQACGRHVKVLFNVWQDHSCISHLKCGHIMECEDVSVEFRGFLTRKLAYDNYKPFQSARHPIMVRELFTGKNLIILTLLHDRVLNCGLLAKLIFISILYASSKMAFIPESKINDAIKKGWRPSWAVPAYWLPKRFIEYNPLDLFVKTATRILNVRSRNITIGDAKDVLRKKARVAFLSKDVLELDLPPHSVDIITDPPYYDDIQYAELYYFYSLWLSLEFNYVFKRELVINKARGFTYSDYINIFEKHIEKLYNLTQKKAILILRNGKKLQDLINIISKYYYIYDMLKITQKMRRSRIGDVPSQYKYCVINATVKR